MKNAINQLLNDLDKLGGDIDTLDNNQRGRVYRLLRETLNAFKNTNDLHEEEFLKPLMRLSEEVISIRLSEEPGVNKKLTIPCYDLFLPFKAISDCKNVEKIPDGILNVKVAIESIINILEKKEKADSVLENNNK